MVWPTPLRVRACGSTSGMSGAPKSGAAPCAGIVGGFALERRARVDDAVIVFDLVTQLQRAADLRLRILGERDRGRAVGNGGERPGRRRRSRAGYAEPCCATLKRRSCVPAGAGAGFSAVSSLRPPFTATSSSFNPVARITRIDPAGTATAGPDARGFARTQARQDHRRPRRVRRRRDPGIDAIIGRRRRHPCQLKAAATLRPRSPPAAKKVAIRRTAPARATRSDRGPTSCGIGQPARRLRAARKRASTCARHSAADMGSLCVTASRSVTRGGRPMQQAAARSMRRSASACVRHCGR